MGFLPGFPTYERLRGQERRRGYTHDACVPRSVRNSRQIQGWGRREAGRAPDSRQVSPQKSPEYRWRMQPRDDGWPT